MSYEDKELNVVVGLNVGVGLNVSTLAETLGRFLDHDDLIQFVKDLDLAAADWDVTEKLYEHFSALMANKEKEDEEDEGMKA